MAVVVGLSTQFANHSAGASNGAPLTSDLPMQLDSAKDSSMAFGVFPLLGAAAHFHRDDRVATVVSSTWHIEYGDKFEEAKRKALSPGKASIPNRPVSSAVPAFVNIVP